MRRSRILILEMGLAVLLNITAGLLQRPTAIRLAKFGWWLLVLTVIYFVISDDRVWPQISKLFGDCVWWVLFVVAIPTSVALWVAVGYGCDHFFSELPNAPAKVQQSATLIAPSIPSPPTSKVPKAAPTPRFSPTPSPQQARIEVRKIEPKIAPDGTSIVGVAGPFYGINVEYHNRGVLPADEVAWQSAVMPVTGPEAKEETPESIRLQQDRLLNLKSWTELMEHNKGVEYYSDDQKTAFFTIPNSANDPLFSTVEGYSKSEDASKRIYVAVTFKYTDRSLGTHARIVTEACTYFVGNISSMHICGRNRTVLEYVK